MIDSAFGRGQLKKRGRALCCADRGEDEEVGRVLGRWVTRQRVLDGEWYQVVVTR